MIGKKLVGKASIAFVLFLLLVLSLTSLSASSQEIADTESPQINSYNANATWGRVGYVILLEANVTDNAQVSCVFFNLTSPSGPIAPKAEDNGTFQANLVLNETGEYVWEKITAIDSSGNPSIGSVNISITSEGIPQIQSQLAIPTKILRGKTFKAILGLNNIGNGTAYNISVAWNLPDGFTLENSTTCQELGVQRSCNITAHISSSLSAEPGNVEISGVVHYE